MTHPRRDHEDGPQTPVLRAMGIGGFFGSLLVAAFLADWRWVLVAIGIFVLTATVNGMIEVGRHQGGDRG